MGWNPLDCCSQFGHDAWQELKGTPFRDDAFTEQDWQRHLTWRRYVPEPSISGLVILTLAPVWMWSVVVSMCLGLYATYAEPNGWPNVSSHMELLTPFSLTSFALSLLMLFKTNSSYSRWWEARTLWGSGYITVRSILRLVISFVGREHPHLVAPLYRWTAALLPALAAYLRQRDHYLEDHLEKVLLPDELEFLRRRLEAGGIPPIAALQVMSRLLDRAALQPMERQQLESLLSHVDTIIGGCERILRQPVPYAYNRHTHRFILCYITFLPFAFWPRFGWATLPIMAVFTFLICGVENVGVQIEEPMRVLPLNGICAGSLKALRLMMADLHLTDEMATLSAASSEAGGGVPADNGGGKNGGGGGDGEGPTLLVPPGLTQLRLDVVGPPPRVPSAILPLRSGERLQRRTLLASLAEHRSGGSSLDGGARRGSGGVEDTAIELSLPSEAVSTPPTARPISPDLMDAPAMVDVGSEAQGTGQHVGRGTV